MDLCAETMTLVEFVSLVQETYDSMVALVVPFILRTSMTEKHALLAQLVAGNRL
jgi:predicted FMN-binding regulatory protein PaiB